MSSSTSEYYRPVNVFRQPALMIKKRGGEKEDSKVMPINTSSNYQRTWKNDVGRIGSPLLRKASEDFNDHFTTKKLKSEYWKLDDDTKATSLPSDMSVVGNTILISNMDRSNNLKLININSTGQKSREPTVLHEVQTISVPETPIVSACLLPSWRFNADYFDGDDQLLLCGHQDGVVNLVSTSMEHGNAKIAKRYKHGKFLSHEQSDTSKIDNWLQPFLSSPVRKIKPWNDRGYASLVNDSLFIYDLNRAKKPQYLQSFPGLEGMAINDFNNPFLLSLCGGQFGNSGIALLDLRSRGVNGNLYIPDCRNPASYFGSRSSKNHVSYDCTWIDEFHLANCVNDTVKIWDIRSTGGEAKCEILPMKGCIESLKYTAESKTLYTGDDQGNILSWDLSRLENVKKATLAQGLNSIFINDTQELIHEVSQCGNIIVSGANAQTQFSQESVCGSVLIDTVTDGSLVTLNSHELGFHQVCDVECHTSSVKDTQVTVNEDKLHEDSDVTLFMQDLSESSNHSDCSSAHTLHSVGVYELNNIEKGFKHGQNTDSIYSLKNLVLSGSTIYQEVI